MWVDADWFLGKARRCVCRRVVWARSGMTRPWFGWCGVLCMLGPVCGWRWALWDSRAICVSDEVGEVFVGVGEHLVEIVIRF
jgi:hypothetical protein